MYVLYVYMCVHMDDVHVYLQVCVTHVVARGGQQSYPVTFCLIPLRQDPPLNLGLGWQPASPGDSPSPSLMGLEVGVRPQPAFSMSTGDLNSGPHVCTSALTH